MEARDLVVNALNSSTHPEVQAFKAIVADESKCWDDFVKPYKELSQAAKQEVISRILALNNNYVNLRLVFLAADDQFTMNYLLNNSTNQYVLESIAQFAEDDSIREALLARPNISQSLKLKIIAGMRNKDKVKQYASDPVYGSAYRTIITRSRIEALMKV